jgi:predicted DNA-binding transcriptional regulator AlpA
LTATAATGPAALLKDLTDPLLSKRELMAAFRVSAKTIYNWKRNQNFPAPVRLSARCYRWSREAVVAWLTARFPTSPCAPPTGKKRAACD